MLGKNISSNNIMSNRNKLVRRLLSTITDSDLQNLVEKEASACPQKVGPNPYSKEKCPTTDTVFLG